MPSVYLAPTIRQRFFDANNLPLAGGKLFTFIGGTNIPLATYKDQTGTVPNTNPVICDGSGYCDVWMQTGFYKFILQDSLGNQLWSEDQVSVAQTSPSAFGPIITQSILDNQSAYVNVASLLITSSVNQCVSVEYTIIRSTGVVKRRERGMLYLLYDSVNGWSLTRESQGADALNKTITSLAITTGGQVQYKSDSMGGTYAGQISWRITNAFAAEGI